MDLRVLSVFQRTLADQCRCWGVVVSDDTARPIGCAALCLFNVGLMKVLFCGLPVPSGTTHLRFLEAEYAKPVIQEINRFMQRLAKVTRSHLIVFKELSDTNKPLKDQLTDLGYVRGDVPPLHVLEATFPNFDAYLNALKNRYRAQVRRSQKKLINAGFEVASGRGAAFFAQHFDERTYRLYLAMHARAEHKLEVMPLAFFRELAAKLDNEALLTLISKDGKPCAFTFSITRGAVHYNLYSGLDYAQNNEGDLYFNLFYNDLDQAFRAGAHTIHLGQTSDSFKSRLGTRAEPLYFFAHARLRAFNWILHRVSSLAFPKVEPVEQNDVFAGLPSHSLRPQPAVAP